MNPYSWNTVNPDLFYGRQELLHDMIKALSGQPRNSFGIAASRRMGKSTLLRRVEQELKSRKAQWEALGMLIIPVFIDTQALPRPLQAEVVWEEILSQINQLSLAGWQNKSPITFATFKEIILCPLLNSPLRTRLVVSSPFQKPK